MKKINRSQVFKVCLFIAVVVHTVGVFGITSSFQNLFLSTTPVVLLLSTTFLFINFEKVSRLLLLLFFVCFVLGFSAEAIGVNTGYLFGSYHYGKTLGFKVLGVPLTIAINWASLCIASASVISKMKIPQLLQVLIAGVLPVGIDILIEPLCSKLDFWHWMNGEVPMFNYTTWLFFSLVFCGIFIFSRVNLNNPYAKYYLLVQTVFFALLNLIM